jgi:exopolysaccharide production protein ExoQ
MVLASTNDGIEHDFSRHAAEAPVITLAVTYGLCAVFIFFAMQGYVPYAGSHADLNVASDTLYGQLLQAVVWIILLFLMRPYYRQIVQMCWRMKSMSLLMLLAPISSLWSQIPRASLQRGIFLILGTLFAYYLVSRFSPIRLAQVVVVAGLAVALISIGFVMIIPSIGLDIVNGGAWQGVMHSKNGCAGVVAFLLTPAFAFEFPTRAMNRLRHCFIGLGCMLLIMADAKTAWILIPLYIGAISALSKMKRMKALDATIVLGATILCASVVVLSVPLVLPSLLSLLGKSSDLTGRIPLWSGAVLSILKRPILGYGYVAFWTGLQGESMNVFMSARFVIYQAQNGILETALQLGVVGVSLVLCTAIAALRDAFLCFRGSHWSAARWYTGVILLTLAYNVDEGFFAAPHSLPWLMYTIACAGLRKGADEARFEAAQCKKSLRFTGIGDEAMVRVHTVAA